MMSDEDLEEVSLNMNKSPNKVTAQIVELSLTLETLSTPKTSRCSSIVEYESSSSFSPPPPAPPLLFLLLV